MGKLGFLLVLGIANLHYRAKATDFYIYRFATLGVNTQLSLSSLMLSPDVHSVLNNRFEVLVEITHHVSPFLLALGNLVKLLLHLGGEVIIHDSGEILQEEVVDNDTDVCGHEFTLVATCYLGAGLLGNLLALEHN